MKKAASVTEVSSI